ncbi:hypothetical protein WJX72_005437 [[Myrmecia] bisecta]|uniref:Maintenance of Photosystem II under High light 2 C-terminal domain-containing protein n=1 Tax=[Myrmecia] bisecta TaxID=41462 RepID=A0AAW1QQS7_9CHLO
MHSATVGRIASAVIKEAFRISHHDPRVRPQHAMQRGLPPACRSTRTERECKRSIPSWSSRKWLRKAGWHGTHHVQVLASTLHVPPAPVVCSRRTNAISCKASQEAQPAALSRRAVASALAGLPILLGASKALALIPDDDDEELIEKAKANRKTRLADERAAEKQYVKEAGFANGEIVTVQRAVKKLAKSGSELESGNLSAVATTVGDSWVGAFEKVALDLSTSKASKKSANDVLKGISALEASARAGSLADSKRNFVSTVSALQTWANAAGIAGSIKGL